MMAVIKETKGDKIFNVINYIILTIILLITFYPLLFVVIASISNPDMINSGQVVLLPKDISFDGYKRIFQDPRILSGYKNTIIYTVFGTLLNLAVTIPAAYALSRKDLVGRNIITIIFMITMFFSGGLIPTFLLMKRLHLLNTRWAILILGATSMWNIVITRTFFENNIPGELQEAAEIDGCSDFKIFFSIILPLSSPIIAVMTLFFGVAHWNNYFKALIYLSDKKLFPLQIILREILVKSEFDAQMLLIGSHDTGTLMDELRAAEQIKYALIIIATLPVMLAYPFVQKYFVKGVMVGAIKG
ncbi:carbohydrate ABC transporter permease [Xylanivirga thermophila]|uniref:carbohydrate ABC transporter permease n=1 Tax=Xylanivirga thermophila TaxID=2496273 RepID=UPI00101BD716